MAPELVEMMDNVVDGVYSLSVDVFAYGMIMYEVRASRSWPRMIVFVFRNNEIQRTCFHVESMQVRCEVQGASVGRSAYRKGFFRPHFYKLNDTINARSNCESPNYGMEISLKRGTK